MREGRVGKKKGRDVYIVGVPYLSLQPFVSLESFGTSSLDRRRRGLRGERSADSDWLDEGFFFLFAGKASFKEATHDLARARVSLGASRETKTRYIHVAFSRVSRTRSVHQGRLVSTSGHRFMVR